MMSIGVMVAERFLFPGSAWEHTAREAQPRTDYAKCDARGLNVTAEL